jgi:hypothetical protein
MQTLARARLRRGLAVAISVAYLSGCATASKDITAAYVSPVQYQSYDCQQLAAETERLQSRYTELGGRLDQAATNDKTLMGVGLVLFWPALFALGGTKSQEAEYSRLKGEYDAVQKAAVEKRCLTQPVAAASSAPAVQAAASEPSALTRP